MEARRRDGTPEAVQEMHAFLGASAAGLGVSWKVLPVQCLAVDTSAVTRAPTVTSRFSVVPPPSTPHTLQVWVVQALLRTRPRPRGVSAPLLPTRLTNPPRPQRDDGRCPW